MGWDYLFIPKLQRCNRWSLGMDTWFHPTLYRACDYLSVLGLKLTHVSKMGYWLQRATTLCNWDSFYTNTEQIIKTLISIKSWSSNYITTYWYQAILLWMFLKYQCAIFRICLFIIPHLWSNIAIPSLMILHKSCYWQPRHAIRKLTRNLGAISIGYSRLQAKQLDNNKNTFIEMYTNIPK